MSVNILILTQYYPPETGAPQNRLSSLAAHLQSYGNNVEVLTAMPNYPSYKIFEAYKGKRYVKEEIDNITVHRTYIYANHKKGRRKRLYNYFSFVISSLYAAALRLTKKDVIICESPPLFLGITAVLLKKKWKCKLVFNVSDLWPESAEKLGIVTNKWLLKRSYKLARWIYKHSSLICGQTQGIVQSIAAYNTGKQILWLPNGIDIKKLPANNTTQACDADHEFIILYAGIIGYAQGLEIILHAAKKLQSLQQIKFVIIGDGPEKINLQTLNKQLQINNVTFLPNQSFTQIAEWLCKCSAYIVPLKKLDLFKGAIPSKLFEPLAFGKPILLGVDGEAKKLFIDDANAGLFYEPENTEALYSNILTLYNNPSLGNQLGSNGKNYVLQHFTRDKIAQQFWQVLQTIQ